MTILSADELCRKLGMSSSSVSGYKHGQVVTEERDSSNDKDLCLLVVTAIPTDLDKAWEFLSKERVIEIQDATLSQGHIDTKTFTLTGFKFDHGSKNNITKYAMSKDESHKVKHAHDKEAAFLEVLSARAKKYWEHGVPSGMDPYEGKRHDPGSDLVAANEAADKIFKVTVPVMSEELHAVPAKSKHPEMHSLGWNITEGNDMTSVVLVHSITYKTEKDGFFTVKRKFYSGCDFDASQISVGVLPMSEDPQHSVIFYVNHTYVALVAGVGGGLKKSIGRKKMKGKLVATMEKAQKQFGK